MRDLGLAVTVDAIGNIIGVRGGGEDVAAVMFGSHIDTVGTGGRYDGLYGVLAGPRSFGAPHDAGPPPRPPPGPFALPQEGGSRLSPPALGGLGLGRGP